MPELFDCHSVAADAVAADGDASGEEDSMAKTLSVVLEQHSILETLVTNYCCLDSLPGAGDL